jgi:hypothetical protein
MTRSGAFLAILMLTAWPAHAQTAHQRATVRGNCNVVINAGPNATVTVSGSRTCTSAAPLPAPRPDQRLDDLIRVQFASAPLTGLEVVWTFNAVPPPVLDGVDIGNAMIDTDLLRDDEVSRLPARILQDVRAGLTLNDKLPALLAAVVDGWDEKALYSGEPVATALARWRGKAGSDAWSENIGTDLDYIGPRYQLILPLNLQRNAAISLGLVADDPRYGADETNALFEDLPSLKGLTNFAFSADARRKAGSLVFTWKYGPESLDRAAERGRGVTLTAGFPEHFTFIVPRAQLSKGGYVDAVTRDLTETSFETAPASRGQWSKKSTLEIYVNGVTGPHYLYDVLLEGDYGYAPDRGAYDAPETLYSYVAFEARLRRIEYSR